ncbi:MAG: DUF1295 domain-containing protein [Coraliomargaritaceae bacterium]
MISIWVTLLLLGCLLASVAYSQALRMGTMALVDVVWSSVLALGAVSFAIFMLVNGEATLRMWIVFIVLIAWSSRLSLYLLRDRVFSAIEDSRYANLARHWGSKAKRNFYFLFLGQVPLSALFLFPVVHAARNPTPLALTDALALLIALVALIGESLADHQLAAFRRNPSNAGKVCQSGLWRYSRHPNYFFEWLHWFAYAAFALGAPNAWLSLLGPLAMYLFLRYITGIPHAERSSLRSRGEAYRRYQQTTSPFFPWIPRLPHS